jgi:hypothetical protein
MIRNHWLSIAHHDTQPLAQHYTPWLTTTRISIAQQWLWAMVSNAEQEVVNHGVLWWVSGCESWFVMLCQRFWIMVSYAEPGVLNHGELCWASGCESWFIILIQWLWIMVSYAEPVDPRLTTIGSELHTMINKLWLTIAHHNSQSLAQYITPWFTATSST